MFKHDGSRMPFTNHTPTTYTSQPIKVGYIRQALNTIYKAEPKHSTVQSDILDFSFFNIENVRGYYTIDDNGNKIRLVNAEDIARGAGIVKVDTKVFSEKSEKKIYTSIRWKEFNQYAQSRLPYLQKYADSIIFNYIQFPINKDSYIPMELAVQIIMCADSEKAKDFQALVSIKIAKEIDRLLDMKYMEQLDSLRTEYLAFCDFAQRTAEAIDNDHRNINSDIRYLKDMVYTGSSLNRLYEAINNLDELEELEEEVKR